MERADHQGWIMDPEAACMMRRALCLEAEEVEVGFG